MKDPSTRQDLCPTPIVWQDIAARLPATWEMVRYGLGYERGVCTFADEYGERLHLAWERTADRPDFGRLVSDLTSEERAGSAREDDAERRVDALALDYISDWHGVAVETDEMAKTRASRYFNRAQVLVEVTLFWPASRDRALEQCVLDSLSIVAPGPWRTWQAFGLCAKVPAALFLSEFRCLPADVTWTFRGRRSYPEVRIRRLGFVDMWLKGPLEAWLREQIKGWRIIERGARTAPAGHRVERIVARGRRPGWQGMLGRRVTRYDAAVACMEEHRVYHVSVLAGRKDRLMPGLRCPCGELLAPGEAGGLPRLRPDASRDWPDRSGSRREGTGREPGRDFP